MTVPIGEERQSIRGDLLRRIASLPARLEAAEAALLQASGQVEGASNALAERRATLLLDPEAITGRNEHQREAQLLHLTREERRALTAAEAERDQARLRLNRLQHEFAAARVCARLIAGVGTEP
jgi:hypothetical protein